MTGDGLCCGTSCGYYNVTVGSGIVASTETSARCVCRQCSHGLVMQSVPPPLHTQAPGYAAIAVQPKHVRGRCPAHPSCNIAHVRACGAAWYPPPCVSRTLAFSRENVTFPLWAPVPLASTPVAPDVICANINVTMVPDKWVARAPPAPLVLCGHCLQTCHLPSPPPATAAHAQSAQSVPSLCHLPLLGDPTYPVQRVPTAVCSLKLSYPPPPLYRPLHCPLPSPPPQQPL
jgi:hypothetical protein